MTDPDPRVAAVCRELERGDLRTVAAALDAERLLDRILTGLAGDADPAGVAADLDEFDARLIEFGIAGGLVAPTQRVYRPSPPTADDPHPAFDLWTCPTDRCSRWQPVEPGAAEAPGCALQGVPMARKGISA